MIKNILKNWPINIKKSSMIGDQKSDQICANKSNIYFEFVSKDIFSQIKKLATRFD